MCLVLLLISLSFFFVFLGQNLAVFRDDKGYPHALDAYCPHLGAHLAVGGQVFGNCIECPFHGWRFRGDDGKCTYIPYSDKSKFFPYISYVYPSTAPKTKCR